MRDLNIHYLMFLSASRDGVLIELLLSEFLSGHWVVDDEGNRYYQVEVFRHKTILSSGTAHLNLEPHVFEWVCTFVDKVRPRCPILENRNVNTEDDIQLPWSRKDVKEDELLKMSSGSVSKRLRASFISAGVFSKNIESFTCNILRKASSTALHEVEPQLDDIISETMSHSKATAEQHYRRPNT